MMESQSFKNVTDFNRAYENVRNDILERHGFKKGDKVRLKQAIMMYQNFDGNWLKASSVKTDMLDRVKRYDNNGNFKLVALV